MSGTGCLWSCLLCWKWHHLEDLILFQHRKPVDQEPGFLSNQFSSVLAVFESMKALLAAVSSVFSFVWCQSIIRDDIHQGAASCDRSRNGLFTRAHNATLLRRLVSVVTLKGFIRNDSVVKGKKIWLWMNGSIAEVIFGCGCFETTFRDNY